MYVFILFCLGFYIYYFVSRLVMVVNNFLFVIGENVGGVFVKIDICLWGGKKFLYDVFVNGVFIWFLLLLFDY